MPNPFLSVIPPTLQSCIRVQEPMSNHTSFRIGGPADYFFEPTHADQIAAVTAIAREQNLPVTIIGNGSNLLISDRGIRGLVIAIDRHFSGITPMTESDARVLEEVVPGWLSVCESYPHTPVYVDFGMPPTLLKVLAGTPVTTLAAYAKKQGLAGLEFACGIPGTVGGGVFMNAGAYGNSIQDVVIVSRSMSLDGRQNWICGEDHRFDYRSSYFSRAGHIILESYFCLRPGRPSEVKALHEDYMGRRRKTQPLDLPSAGSMFKRPHGYFAGKLISDAGLKGFRVGDAAVSEKHAGFVVNLGRARAEEVRQLILQIQRRVFEDFGVQLETEVRFLGDWDPVF